jgi:outer membrane murein-binding lipoprotein Lpp
MKYTSFIVMMAAILAVILAAGCTSAPVKETSTSNVSVTESQATPKTGAPVTETQANDRYVEISLLDGTKIGGKYVSETSAFTTILVMYTIDPSAYIFDANNKAVKDPNKYFAKGNGAEVSIKNSLINTMVTIDEPTSMIEAALQEMNTTAAAMTKAAEDKAEGYRIAKEQREASKPTTHQPKKYNTSQM